MSLSPLTLASRATVGLEPGVLVRVRSVRPAECIFAGIDAGDLRIYLDADTRSNPRAEVEAMLPAMFFAKAGEWAQELARAAALVPISPKRIRRSKQQEVRA